jgi:hypothetical protein
MATTKKYDVLSPDGFAISATETYNSVEKAKAALKQWMKRYEMQGYYSSNNGRISLNELESHCRIITL